METVASLIALMLAPTLGVMVLVWFFQLSKMFTYLRENHLQEYREMGEPTLFLNNTIKNNIAFLRFIRGSKPSELNDDYLVKKCHFLTKFLYASYSLFIGFIVLMFCLSYARS